MLWLMLGVLLGLTVRWQVDIQGLCFLLGATGYLFWFFPFFWRTTDPQHLAEVGFRGQLREFATGCALPLLYVGAWCVGVSLQR